MLRLRRVPRAIANFCAGRSAREREKYSLLELGDIVVKPRCGRQ